MQILLHFYINGIFKLHRLYTADVNNRNEISLLIENLIIPTTKKVKSKKVWCCSTCSIREAFGNSILLKIA